MNDQEIFNSEELKENEQRKRELIELVASKEAVLIVGAGSSVRLDYVTWDGLLKKLETLASECDDGFKRENKKRKYEPLEYAEDIKLHILGREGNLHKYFNLLDKLFSPKSFSFDDLHKTLVSLPFRGILTTNYDKVLEAALGEKNPLQAYDNSLVIDPDYAVRVHEFLRAMTDSSLTRRVAHLHGRYDIPKSIILSIKDYENAYGLKLTANQEQRDSEWTLHRKLLWAVLATRRVVFVGFSMDDPYFEKMLETVSKDLWRWDKSIHFAIMSISPDSVQDSKDKAERLKREYGIETVFYENLDGKHLSLDHFIADIAQECNVEIQPAIVSQDESGDNDLSEDEKSKPIASESQYELSWIKLLNELMEKGISDDES